MWSKIAPYTFFAPQTMSAACVTNMFYGGDIHGTFSDKVGEVERVGAGTPSDTNNTKSGEPAKDKVCGNIL